MGEEIPIERWYYRTRYFTAISSSSVRMVADLLPTTTSTADELSGVSTLMTLNDLELSK